MTPAHSPVALRYRGATHLTPYSYPTRRSSDLSRRKARRAPDAHLQIARRLVQHLSLAASRKREAPGGRQRVGLRRAIRQADLAGPEHRIGRRRDEDRPEIAAGLSDVAASDPESLRGKVLAGHPYRVGPVRDAAFAA